MDFGWGAALGRLSQLALEFFRKYRMEALYFSQLQGFPPGVEKVTAEGREEGMLWMGYISSLAEYAYVQEKGAIEFEPRLAECLVASLVGGRPFSP
ncbi:hypothetical protein JY651_17220 [Pyxidicoccus parkwayensis]|uniref:TetR family transcriptional regulator n=1 Tax=Pyxidicoccus parkwayensis TaxID=2813578 RepID=A0ABX7P821_9BACT|nr:hypothetical protein [Pyxidicoccus parkwaysis]QSQ26562.1 hypothetical protein JY651_17220 [Pyxidicoccus parkwaysis]